MHNLAKRQETLEVESDVYEGATLYLRSVTDEEVFQVMEDVGLTLQDLESGTKDMKPSAVSTLIQLFRENLKRVEGIQIEGEPFDADNPEHVGSLPIAVKMEGASELIQYPFMDREMGKGSAGQGEHSPRERRQRDTSRPVSASS